MSKTLPFNVSSVCRWFGISKSGFYKKKKHSEESKKFEDEICLHINALRKFGLMCGARKTKIHLKEDFDIIVARDKLFDVMRENDLQSKFIRKKVQHSSGVKQIFENMLTDEFKKSVTKFGQVIVTDITYVKLLSNKFCYISLVTDLATRKILGYNVAQTLLAEESVNVMRKTLKKYKLPKDCIHHSDKGVQYTSKLYTDFLKKNNFKISMTGAGKCYDNACAERVFNTLKNEFGFNAVFSSLKEVKRELKSFVDIYNNRRYHMSLDYRTPQSVFLEMQEAA